MLRDLRRALRGLIAQPAFSLTAMITLALAVGVNALMLDVLDRLLIRPPTGVRDPQQVARLYFSPFPGTHFPRTSEPDFLDLQAGLTGEVEAMATSMGERLSLGRGSSVRLVQVVDCSEQYFDVLGLAPAIGVLPGRSARTPPDAAVISHALWAQAFGQAPEVLGRALRLGTQTFTIVGVAPKGFTGIDFDPTDVWLPIDMRGPLSNPGWREQRGSFTQDVIARIKPEVLRRQLEIVATRIYREHNSSWYKQPRLVAGDLLLSRAPGANPVIDVALWVTAVSGLVLLIGCANVGGLLLVRGIARSRESAIKVALGASRWRLIREVVAEALLIGLAAGASAVILVIWADRIVPNLFADGLWQSMEVFDYRVAGLAALVSSIAIVLLSIIPVLRLAVSRQLMAGRRVDMHRGYSLALDGLLAGQVALTLPLLVGAGLFAISFRQARHQDIGLDIDHMVVVSTNLFEDGEPQRNHDVHRALQERVARLPHVEAAAVVMSIPLQGGLGFVLDIPDEVPVSGPREYPFVNAVDPSYLKVAGIRLIAGRPFTDRDNRAGAKRVALVNQAMARERWGGKPVLGRCFYMGDRKAGCLEVIGVIADAWSSPDSGRYPAFLVPLEAFRDLSTNRAVILRTAVQPDALLDQIRHEARAAGADLPYVDVYPLADVLFTMLRPWKLGASMFIAFGTLALLISAVGLAGTISYAVGRRRRELGVRKALGAQSPDLVRVVLRRSVVVVLVGTAAGLVGAFAAAGAMKSMFFGIQPNDWRIFVGSTVTMLAVAALAAALPSRRATLVDPAELLRAE